MRITNVRKHFLYSLLIAALTLSSFAISLSAEAGIFGFGGDSWKEEVLLHDGSTMIVKRSLSYGGRHEIGQSIPVSEQTASFTIPQTGKSYIWTSEYGEELGRTNFNLLAIHVLDGTPYIIAAPNLCLSYNKWGRPNPPYVIFKYTDKAWQRIQISELPQEFNTLNVLNNIKEEDTRGISSMRTISADAIKARNAELRQPENQSLVRGPVKGGGVTSCEVIIQYKCGWGAPGEFNRKYFERVCK